MTGRENGQDELQRRRAQYKRRTEQYSVRHLTKLNADSIAAGYDVSSLVLILIEDLRQLNNIYCTMADKAQPKDQAADGAETEAEVPAEADGMEQDDGSTETAAQIAAAPGKASTPAQTAASAIERRSL